MNQSQVLIFANIHK